MPGAGELLEALHAPLPSTRLFPALQLKQCLQQQALSTLWPQPLLPRLPTSQGRRNRRRAWKRRPGARLHVWDLRFYGTGLRGRRHPLQLTVGRRLLHLRRVLPGCSAYSGPEPAGTAGASAPASSSCAACSPTVATATAGHTPASLILGACWRSCGRGRRGSRQAGTIWARHAVLFSAGFDTAHGKSVF